MSFQTIQMMTNDINQKIQNIITIFNNINKKKEKAEEKKKKRNSFKDEFYNFIYNLCPDLKEIPNLPEVKRDNFFIEENKKVKKNMKKFKICKKMNSKFRICTKNSKNTKRFGRNLRNKINSKNTKKIRISKKITSKFKISKKINNLVKKGLIIVRADCQSGKTNFIICSSFINLFNGESSVIVVRNLYGDANQMINNINNRIDLFEKHIKDTGVDKQRKFNIEIIEGNKLNQSRIKHKVRKSLNGECPRIIVLLGNKTQLGHLNEISKQTIGNFNLYIDEIDKVDYGNNSEDESIFNILKELKNHACQVFGVTATPLDCIFSENELRSENQLYLSPGNDYRGFIDFQVKLLKEDTVSLNKKSSYEDICKSDKNLIPFLTEFSNSEPEFSVKDNKYIPNICLIKNTRINESQQNLFDGICSDPTFRDKFVIITYNGFGICMSHPINIENENFSVNPGDFFKADIADVLQYLKDNGDVEKFPRIIIIAGELAGRCISYVSSDYVWHLTDMYYNPAASTSIPEMIQSAGRLCGRNKGKSHLHLHVTKKVADALYSGYHFTNEIIKRAIEKPLIIDGKEENLATTIKSVPMLNKKMPVKRKLTNKVKILKKDFNLVKKDDGGEILNSYKYDLLNENKTSEEGASVEESKSEKITREENETNISFLRRTIENYINNTEEGKKNNFKTASEWLDITGLCGFKNKTSLHHSMLTHLVRTGFLERQDNKVRLLKKY